jgi:hypothetical protein
MTHRTVKQYADASMPESCVRAEHFALGSVITRNPPSAQLQPAPAECLGALVRAFIRR